jgi:pimeloyl-ACP methyl ester carboxylesterase
VRNRLVAVVLVVLLVLGAAGTGLSYVLSRGSDSSSSPRGGPATLAPTPDPEPGSEVAPRPALAPFYGQTIDWQLCRDDSYECGTLTVPVDYRDPGGETVDLALLKVPAADQDARVGSLVINPGGPGASGVEYASYARSLFRDPLLDSFDIVGFDPRGTGDSDPVDCLPDDELTTYLDADPIPDDAAQEASYADERAAFWQGCADNSDDLLGHITTVEAARDMDVLRSALGQTQLTYYGASYGTELGATYADLFPAQVGRFVLDGAVDLRLDVREASLRQAEGFETALRSFLQSCVDEGDCDLGDSVDEGLSTIEDLLASLADEPLPTADPSRPLTEGAAFNGISAALYSEDSWGFLQQGLTGALDGNGLILQALADAQSGRQPDGSFSSNLYEAFPAISCLDDPYSIGPDEVAAQVPDFVAASPTFGEAFAWGLLACRGITVQATEKDRTLTAAGAAPIVVVGTTRDPATPYSGAVSMADQLESGVLVSRDGDGHTAYSSGNECIDDALEAYLIQGTVPQDGLEC